MRHPRYYLICFVVFAGAGAWGLYWLPQRMLLDAGMTGGWGTAGQFLISLAVLTPVAVWRLMTGRQVGLRHWVCGLLVGSGIIFYANSLLMTEVVRALIFFYLTPLWATLVEVAFLRKRPGWPRAASVALALGGVWITVGLDVGVPVPENLGDWFGLISGILVAAGAARTEIEEPGVFQLLFMVIFFGFVSAALQYPLLTDVVGTMPTFEVAFKSLPLLLGVSLLFVLPTTAVIFWAPQHIGTGIFGILILSELVIGVISAALLTDEAFGWREATGATLVVLAGIVEVMLNRTPAPAETGGAVAQG